MPRSKIHIDILKDYLAGKLDGKAMHAVEREALEDPFLAEALEGLMQHPDESVAGLEALKSGLKERLTPVGRPGEQSIRRGIRYWWYGVAALFVLGLGLYLMTQWDSDISGTRNITQEIARGVSPAPDREQGMMPDSENNQEGKNQERLASNDSASRNLPIHSKPDSGMTGDKIARTDKVINESRVIPGGDGQPVVSAGQLMSKVTGRPDTSSARFENHSDTSNPADLVALNARRFRKNTSLSPALIAQQSESRLTKKQTRSRSYVDTSQVNDSEKVAGAFGTQRLAKANPPLNDMVETGSVAIDQAGVVDKGSIDMQDRASLAKDPDLVMQKSKLRPVFEMKAYVAYIEAEMAKLKTSGELDETMKGVVLLKFLIPENNTGKPSHISVEYSSAKQLNRTAKKLLSEGPQWEVIPGTQAPYWGWYSVTFR